ncbi:MAG: alpha-D-glucose phosphate-specific phosphoglucomutase [Roseinatronobacter sp.]
MIHRVPTQPRPGQKPGTSGLRKKTREFMQKGYLENFVQSIFNGIDGVQGKVLVLGGDGRFFNSEAVQIILKMAAASGAAKVIVGQDGLLSTPAASHLIRLHRADGGVILSASHNPGGIEGDFGVKFNTANGGPAPESVTDAIYGATRTIQEYFVIDAPDLDLSTAGTLHLAGTLVEVVDPVEDYANLMERLFDFEVIREFLAQGFSLSFDAMHAVTGPYAREILVNRLGAPEKTLRNASPLPDFGGGHPDPNPVWAHELLSIMMASDAPDFGAASDGDGDRNMILGRGIYVTPSDSLAVIAANAHLVPGYAHGLNGVARSMPSSSALDRVAAAMRIECFATPTGWKYFGNLLDAKRASLCGEESAGTGSDHIREKDGLWAVLMWLNILAARQMSVREIISSHWRRFGRDYYSRHDYEEVDAEAAAALIEDLRSQLDALAGAQFGPLTVSSAEDFSYADPVDGTVTTHQGIQIVFAEHARLVLRLSGTGTAGATLRVYMEQFTPGPDGLDKDPQIALADVCSACDALTNLKARLGRTQPDVIT